MRLPEMFIAGLRQNIIALFGTLRGRFSVAGDTISLLLTLIMLVVGVILGDLGDIWLFDVLKPLFGLFTELFRILSFGAA